MNLKLFWTSLNLSKGTSLFRINQIHLTELVFPIKFCSLFSLSQSCKMPLFLRASVVLYSCSALGMCNAGCLESLRKPLWASQKSHFCTSKVVYLYLHRSMFQLYFSPLSGLTFYHSGHQPNIDLSARAYAESPSSICDNPYISIKMEEPKTHKQ